MGIFEKAMNPRLPKLGHTRPQKAFQSLGTAELHKTIVGGSRLLRAQFAQAWYRAM